MQKLFSISVCLNQDDYTNRIKLLVLRKKRVLENNDNNLRESTEIVGISFNMGAKEEKSPRITPLPHGTRKCLN
jgi:hypothetical protein